MSSENENANSGGTSEHRRSTKPIMEKRRRARINASLAELKALLLEVMRREGSRHSKMEKADILEMTVRHLRQIQKQNFAAAVAADPSILNKYMSGFNECAAEVSRYLNTIDGVDPDIRARLLNHLANCVQGVSETSSPPVNQPAHVHVSSATVAHVRPIQAQPATVPAQVNIAPKPPIVSEQNNNVITAVPLASPPLQQQQQQQPVSLVGGVPILPGKTANGELAFVIPNNVLSGQLPSYVIPVYTGAVNTNAVAVTTPTKSLGSPPTVTTPQQEPRKLDFQCITFPSEHPPKSPEASTKHNQPNMEINNNYIAPSPAREQEEEEDVWRPW